MTCGRPGTSSCHCCRGSQCRWSGQRLPHRIEAELISALGMGTNLDVVAADQSRPSATRAAKLIHPMRRIFIPHLGKMGLACFLPSECEGAHTSRGSRAAEHATAYSRNPRSAACPDVRNDLKCGIPTAGEYPPDTLMP